MGGLRFWLSLVIGPLLGRLMVDSVIDAGVLHLVPCLFTPMNLLIGIGIRRVIGGVVVVCNGLQLRSLRNGKRGREYVVGLPIEVVVRYRQHRFGTTIRVND